MNALGNVLNEVILYKKIIKYFFISFIASSVFFFFTTDSVFAAIGTGGATCTSQSKTSETSLACTVATENIEVGNTAVLFFGGDNVTTVDSNYPLLISVTDSSGNTWTVEGCWTNSRGAANGGATTCIAKSYVTNQLTSGASTITANFFLIDAKAIVVKEFTTASGYYLSATGTLQNLVNTGADPGSMTISGLPSSSYLFVRSTALERAVTTWTPTAGFTTSGCNTTTGAGAASNNGVCGEFIIASATTTATSNPTGTAVDNGSIFIAFEEKTIDTTLSNGTNPTSITIAPGATATSVNAFAFKTNLSTDTISAITLNISNASSTSLVEITDDAGSIVYGSTTNPTGTTTAISLSTNITVTTATTTYKVRITPKSHTNFPPPSIGMLYPVTATVSTWTGTNNKTGSDATSATTTIDNLSTSEVSSSSAITGDGQVTTNYTTPGDSDLNSIVVLRSTSAITDVPVEGTTYTGGETIGSATVACVDTSVSTSTADSCLATGLTNGTPYHFKVFAKDSYGNYSTGLVPTGSPVTPRGTTTLANTTEVGNTTIAPGGSATFVDAFTLQTSTGLDTITDITLNVSNASSTSLIEVTNSAGTTVYGSTTNPSGTTTTITLNQNTLIASSSATTYKIRVTPKSHANLPSSTLGTLYSVIATVSTWTGTNNKTGSDASSSVVTIDNDMPSTTGGAGVVWVTGTTATNNTWRSVTYGNSLFVAVSSTGSGNRVMTSPDGITWTSRTSAADNVWMSITYGNNLFVAVSASGSGNRVMTSPDGITWTSRTSAADVNWYGVTYANDLFVAVGHSGAGNGVMTSPDGITWTSRATVNGNWESITYGNGLFVAVTSTGFGSIIMTSPDGITWTSRTSAADVNWSSITHANGKFVAVANTCTGNNCAMVSLDGITWASSTSAIDNDWYSVTFGNGRFVAVAAAGAAGDKIMTSENGLVWATTTNPANNSWFEVTYGNGKFIAISIDGTSNSVMISTSSNPVVTAGDGSATTSYTTPGDADLNSIVVLRSTSVITDVPVEGTTYTGGETIGSATVACVDTTVSTSTADSCLSTGLTGGATYHFKVFAKDSYGNYSTGLVPTGSPVTIPLSTILSDGFNPNPATIAPGATATSVNAFAFQTSSSTDTITAITLSISNASSTSLVEITDDAGSIVYGSTTNPTGTTTTISLSTNITVTTATTTYKVRITPKSHANLPSPSLGMLYPVTAFVSTWTGTNNKTGSDATSSVTTIDNESLYTTGGAGISWTSRTTPIMDYNWFGVTYGNGRFVAVSGDGFFSDRVMTSLDGITWATSTSAADNLWDSVTYGNGLFVAVSTSGTGNRVMTSPDGITWTSRTSAVNNGWSSVTYGNGLFVAVAFSGTGNRVMTSPDGINWTARVSATDNDWQAVTYGNGLFVAVSNTGTGNRVMTSPDGITWTIRTSAADNLWNSVTYGNGLFVAVSSNGSGNRVMTSPDGITWTSRTSAADNGWYDVTYGNGLFVAVASTGTGNRVMVSPDGINWATTSSATNNDWRSIIYGNGLFVAVSVSGFYDSVMTSSSTLPAVIGGDTQAIVSYTTPGDSDLNSMVTLRSTSAITDVPVEGTTYTGGETIGSATVACVDTSVSTSTADSCLATGLTNGTPYHFKVFAKDNFGNYSTGLVPTGSPATPAFTISTTTLANTTEVGNTTVAPGGSATFVNAFTLQTASTTSIDTITDITLNISNASSTSLIEVTNSAGNTVYGSTTNPTGTTTTITLNQNTLTVTSSLTTYKIRITPKSQADLPSPSIGMLYPVTATVSTWTGTNNKTGSDATSSIVTIDNDTPSTTGGAGINWTTKTNPVNIGYNSVAYGNGIFVAVSYEGTGNNGVMKSNDGINWSTSTSASDNSWASVTYGNGLFVAVAQSGTGDRVMTSPDGITWTSRTSAADNNWQSVTYANGLFVAVSSSGSGNRVMTSPDGITWTSRTSATDNQWLSVTYASGLFVATSFTGTGNRVMTSPDGITWTSRTSATDNEWYSVAYGNGKFVAVSMNGATSSQVMTSSDGVNWSTSSSAVNNSWNEVVYANGLFVAVSSSGSGNRVMTSPDGITWTSRTSATDNQWHGLAFGNGKFVAVSWNGTSNRVMISTSTLPTVTAGDGRATTSYTTPGDADLNSIVVLRSTSEITDVPVEGTTYTGGEIIGSATVACVDTTVSTSTSDSCLSTGLTNGVPYYFKVFAKDSYGNYSTGLVPTGSPVTPVPNTTTLATGVDPSDVTVYPGSSATSSNAFTFQTSTSTDSITAITLNISNASSTSLLEITNDAGSIVYGSTTNPTGTTTTISLSTNITANTTLTQYKVRITPKSQINMPRASLGMSYTIKTKVTGWVGSNVTKLGSDTASSTITIDNLPPATSGNSGINWSTSTSIVDNSWQSVAYGNGIFVAVAQSGTGDRVMTSPDGVTWTSRTSSADNSWKSVTYADGLFIAASYTGTGNRVMTSPDGVTWTSRTTAVDNNWKSITYGNGTFVAVSDTGTSDRVMVSFDGITWSTSTSAVDSSWQSVTYGAGIFVAIADSGANQLMTSPDGITWTARNTPNTNLWRAVTFGNNIFVAVSQDGVNNRVMTSPDGINWTLRTSADNFTWTSVTYGNGIFVAVASDGVGQQVMTSYDGYNWTLQTSSADNLWNSVAYGDGVFVAVSNSGSGNRVMISTSSAVTVTAGDTVATTTYTTPGDGDLHSIIVLTSTSTITDFPVEGTTYTGGEIIGSSTVSCVDTSVATTTSDSCVSTGLTNGTTYYFKVFARDNYGNYSTGITPAGSPVTPNPTTPTVTLGDGSNPSDSTIAPGGATTNVNAFTFSANTGTPTVTDVTVAHANASSTSRIQITSDDGSIIYGSSTNPTGTSTIITLDTPITTTSSSTQYKIQIVPKLQSQLPDPNFGLLYPITSTIINFTTTALTVGTDSSSATITIDNVSPLTSTSTAPSASAGNTQITISYTTPPDSDLNSMVVLRSSLAVSDSPVEGVTYTGGETIGSATVACVDTTVSPSTVDSCIATGLTNGISYHFKLFAKDSYGNYSTGTVPTNSPIAPIPGIITVTIADGTEPGNTTVAPGSSAVNNNSFTLQTDYSTSSVTAVVVALDNASSTSLLEITNDAGSVVYGSTTNPTGATTSITLSTAINVDTNFSQYKIRITPKSQANLPGPSTGIEYTITSLISAWTVSTGTKSGVDATSSVLTIDNLSPSNTSTSTASAGNAQASISYTNPNNSDLNSIVVLRSTSAVIDTPVEGSTYTVGNTIGSATVACVDTSVTPGASDLCFATSLVNDTPYYFKVFAKDSYGNYSTGLVPGGSPVTPSASAVASRVDSYRIRKDNGSETSATYYSPENSEINSAFFNGDAARIRFVISNQGGGISNMSYRLEYSSSSCTTWVTVPKVTDAVASDPVRTSTSYYVSDGGLTTHSSGVSVPSGKSFVSGYIQTFDNITSPVIVNTNEYTEVEFMIRSTSAMTPGTPYCFRVTDAGDASSFTYLQTPSIISKQTQFRPQAGGGGGGYLLIIEADTLTGTTTVTGGGANGNGTSTNEATTTPDGQQSTTTPSQGGDGGGDLGFLKFKNNFAYNYLDENNRQGMVLGAVVEGVCVNFKNRLFFGKTDLTTNGEVSELQYYLKQQGYFNVKETGYFGPVTELALKNYQRDNNIIASGILGKITKDRMKINSCYNKGLDLSMK